MAPAEEFAEEGQRVVGAAGDVSQDLPNGLLIVLYRVQAAIRRLTA